MNKRRLLIADDDALARIGIRTLIPFGDFGFTDIEEAANGIEAFEKAFSFKPDLILTDILMPGLTGIELIHKCHEAGVQTKFIVLSSHEDFNYVREALKSGASDYILKTELEKKTFSRAVSRIFTVAPESELNTAHTENIQERKIRELLFQQEELDDIQIAQAEMLLGKQTSPFISMIVKIVSDKLPSAEHIQDELESPARNVFRELLRGYAGSACVYIGGRTFFMYVPLDIYHLAFAEVKKYIDQLAQNMQNMMFFTANAAVSAGVSDIHSSLRTLPQAFVEAQNAANKALQKKEPVCYAGSDRPVQNAHGEHSAESSIACLTKAFQSLNAEQIRLISEQLLVQLENEAIYTPQRMQSICYMLMLAAQNFVQNLTIDPAVIWNRLDATGSHMLAEQQILMLRTHDEYLNWCRNLCRELQYILTPEESAVKKIIEAKNYIKQHYAENITLDMVAAETGFSPGWFSKTFSKITGNKFIDYVTFVRISKAKELLKTTQYKVLAIAEMVGYDNTTYFSYLFKKETGMTPQEFRQQPQNS